MHSSSDLKEGKNADYIPALAEVDPNIYGIALVTHGRQGVHHAATSRPRSRSSRSRRCSRWRWSWRSRAREAIENNMGVDATGQVFNSIVAVEQYKGAEMNAMVNPGAITATSMVSGADAATRSGTRSSRYYSDFAGRPARR